MDYLLEILLFGRGLVACMMRVSRTEGRMGSPGPKTSIELTVLRASEKTGRLSSDISPFDFRVSPGTLGRLLSLSDLSESTEGGDGLFVWGRSSWFLDTGSSSALLDILGRLK